MKQRNKVITLTIIIIIIIIILITVVYRVSKKEDIEKETEQIVPEIEEYIEDTTGKILGIGDIVTLHSLTVYLQNFYSAYFGVYNPAENERYAKESAYYILNQQYAKDKGMTIEEVNLNIEDMENFSIEVYEAYMLTKYENVEAYFVKYVIRNNKTFEGKEYTSVIYVDTNKLTYEIIPEYNDFDSLKIGEVSKFIVPNTITDRKYNKKPRVAITFDEFSKNKFDNIRRLLLSDAQRAYSLLDEDAKRENFSDFESFENFIKENYRDLFLMSYYTNKMNTSNDKTRIKLYDIDEKFCITMNFETYSKYNFSIERI